MITSLDYGDELQNARRFGPDFDSSGLFLSSDPRVLTARAIDFGHLTVSPPARPATLPPQRAWDLPTANALRLQERASELARAGGGYLYLTPGRYYIGRSNGSSSRPVSEEDADIVIPPNVTLWFAPGAVLVPLTDAILTPGTGTTPPRVVAPRRDVANLPTDDLRHRQVRIEIQGDIVAGIQPIFDVLVEYSATSDPRAAMVFPAGEILLTSRRIVEVYPEWWSASPNETASDATAIRRTTLAVQAAVDAACNRRTTPRRDPTTNRWVEPHVWNERPTIPVVAMGSYVIDAPIMVRSPDDPILNPGFAGRRLDDAGFELLGERGVGTSGVANANFIAADTATRRFPDGAAVSAADAMLDIAGPTRVVVEGVMFNGLLRATECVRVAPTRRVWTHHSFEGCTFHNGFETLVKLRVGRAPTAGEVRDFWNVSITRCRFDPASLDEVRRRIDPNFAGRVISDVEFNLVALGVDLKDCGGLIVQSCIFFSAASPEVLAQSGRFSLNECTFHASRAAHPRLRDRHLSPNFTHGMDIFIEPAGDRPPVDSFVPATFTAREVESQSWQFLGTSEADGTLDPRLGRSAVVLLNLHHSPVTNREGQNLREEVPPALYWGEPGRLGCPLVMVGCTLRGRAPDAAIPQNIRNTVPSRSVLIVGPNTQGDIFEIACHLFDADPMRLNLGNDALDFTASEQGRRLLPNVLRRLYATPLPPVP